MKTYTSEQFSELMMKDMKGETTNEEHDYLRQPENLFRWRRSLVEKRNEGLRHIANRENMLNNKRWELGVDLEEDLEDLEEEEYNEYIAYEAETKFKNGRTQQFMGFVDDALSKVNAMIRATPSSFDPLEITELILDARDIISEKKGKEFYAYNVDEVGQARECLDKVITLLSKGLNN